MKLQLYSATDVHRALPMAEAIEGMKAGYAQLSAGRAQVPLRTPLSISPDDVTLVMPFFVAPDDGGDGGSLGLKLVSVFSSNISRGLPLIHSVVLAIDPTMGQPLALIEGSSLTAIRTGAASGAATEVLARPEATTVAIFGSGVQARRQLEAICTVRRIERVLIYSRSGAETFATEMVGRKPIPDRIEIVDSPAAAVRDADIICAATTSRVPVFDGRDLKPGAHVNGIGSFTPEMQEVDVETVRRSRVIVDSLEAALAEAGDLLIPLNAGLIDLDHISTELGEVINGNKPGRTDAEQITFFKSVGVAVQDAMAARMILLNGSAMGLGATIEL